MRKYEIMEKTQGMNIAIQGEQYGPGIQKNPLMVEDIRLAVFNIKDLGTGQYYTLEEMERFCQEHSIPMVPILERGPFTSFAAYQDMADQLRYDSNKPAEGIVVRPVVPVYSPSLGKMLSVKFVNRNYSD